jgi:lipoate-protein ligase A
VSRDSHPLPATGSEPSPLRRASWQLILDAAAPGAWNMALDEALLEASAADGTAFLRLYGWDPPTLSFGRNEPSLRRYDRGVIERRGLAVVRRPTGGRAVWHSRELTYSVAAPCYLFGSLRRSYLEIHAMLAAALGSLGAAVRLATGRPGPVGVSAGACFASAVGGEVVTEDGRKLVGSAQVRAGGAFLQHGSILLLQEQDVLSSVTRGTSEPPTATGLAELVSPERAAWSEVAEAILGSASRLWGISRRPTRPARTVLARADELRARYESSAWVWRR